MLEVLGKNGDDLALIDIYFALIYRDYFGCINQLNYADDTDSILQRFLNVVPAVASGFGSLVKSMDDDTWQSDRLAI